MFRLMMGEAPAVSGSHRRGEEAPLQGELLGEERVPSNFDGMIDYGSMYIYIHMIRILCLIYIHIHVYIYICI